ncbi:hypothetical protein LOTGIDRAFT_170756 [Lottia gigantea]|uniref:Uncharacterized protein n=1 Tax=Lottia gigantea TaxID=225164 RepID=V4CPZ2_LOTGI|nr:hypothetical protein LOTGIDRAFT_170756 [Lottia gigantea]ESP04510.1 hypothetical protein LOTGIDRAFT_170756 [Lottia gigantea]
MNEFLDKYGTDTTTNFQLMRWANELNISPFYYCMRDEINNLKYKKETKKPNTTAWINKAKPYFVEQIGDTPQGDLDMNNFTITNLKLPEYDNDAVHKKYLMDQLNLIEVNKEHLKERINDVKKFFKRQMNNKDFIDDTKLRQEVTSLKSFIQQQLLNVVDKTQLQPLSSLISNLDDKITKQKVDLKQLIVNINPGISEDKLTTLETKLIDNSEIQKQIVGIKQQLLNVVDKTQLENLKSLISKLDDKITKRVIFKYYQGCFQ